MARKKHNIHYIYKTTCNETGKWYVGMHSTSNENDGYLGSGKRLRRSIRKYGVEAHSKEILEYCDSREELILREIDIVNNELIADEFCMNLKCGGTGGFINEEHRIKAQKSGAEGFKKKFRSDVDFRLKISELSRLKILNAHKAGKIKYGLNFKGKTHSQETKELMSNQRKGTGTGETNSQYGTCWVTKDGLNKKVKKEELNNWLDDGWVQGRKI